MTQLPFLTPPPARPQGPARPPTAAEPHPRTTRCWFVEGWREQR